MIVLLPLRDSVAVWRPAESRLEPGSSRDTVLRIRKQDNTSLAIKITCVCVCSVCVHVCVC